MAEEQPGIAPEPEPAPSGQPEPTPTPSEPGSPGEPSTHYKTLEEADKATKYFQGETDRTKAELKTTKSELQRLTGAYGNLDQIERALDNFIAISQRDDFQAYIGNKLGRSPSPESPDPEEDLLSPEERANRTRLGTLEEKSNRQASSIASIHFNDAERAVKAEWGGLLDQYKPAVLKLFEQIVAKGLVDDPSVVDADYLENLYLRVVPREDRPALYEARAKRADQLKVDRQTPLGTTVPGTERPSAADTTPARNVAEAWARAKRDTEAAAARGG